MIELLAMIAAAYSAAWDDQHGTAFYVETYAGQELTWTGATFTGGLTAPGCEETGEFWATKVALDAIFPE